MILEIYDMIDMEMFDIFKCDLMQKPEPPLKISFIKVLIRPKKFLMETPQSHNHSRTGSSI